MLDQNEYGRSDILGLPRLGIRRAAVKRKSSESGETCYVQEGEGRTGWLNFYETGWIEKW